jgi:TonB-linked SusC/RagA family outer membrane protein
MKRRVLTALLGLFLPAIAFAQQKTVTGKVTSETGQGLAGVSVVIKGTTIGTTTNDVGNYAIRATSGQVLQYRLIGTAPQERTVGSADVINVQLIKVATNLDAIVVTAFGQTASQRALGTAQQTVSGAPIAQTQRENFVNALQGRVAGVDVTSTSGVPGASSVITIRGISSISSSNQPLMIVDGLPLDNSTTNTANLASDAPTSALAFNNRSVDFTNRAADINPEDIESITVLKGPEAAALYGIDAANGAIVITTKRGSTGGQFEYNNSIRFDQVRQKPQVQDVYGPVPGASCTLGAATATLCYFGAPYPAGTTFYDNISNFFQTGVTQKHNLAFSGGSAENRLNYRLSTALTKAQGVVPNSMLNKVNLTAAGSGQATSWLSSDVSMMYTYENNAQPYKGDDGPLVGLLAWPDTNNAQNWLTPAGLRQRLTTVSNGSEIDNPYFSVNRNKLTNRTNRIFANAAFTITPFRWGYFRSNIGVDAYTAADQMLRSPESAMDPAQNGILDVNNNVTRNITSQTLFNVNDYDLGRGFKVHGLLGNEIQDQGTRVDGAEGTQFLDPTFASINNTGTKYSRTVISNRRVVSGFGQATLSYNDYLYLNATGRNDWTSTMPTNANSFFYPSVSGSYVFTDAFPAAKKFFGSGKLRAAYAEVGRDAPPYSFAASLESKTTSYGGYGSTFWGPNPNLKPEFAKSYEFGGEFGWLNDRLGLDVTTYRKRTENQIVQNIRESYGTGFILFNLNGATTENHGVEMTLRGTPVLKSHFSWDFTANFTRARGTTVSLPNALPESYNSDTWLYDNVRNGTEPGLSTMSLTGLFYARNKDCQLLIDPTTGLPIRTSTFVDAKCVDSHGNTVVKGYDRQPDFTVGLGNNFRYKHVGLNFLFDIRKGGDVFNATEHYLTVRGLSKETLDRTTPRVVPGVLRDGKENTANPTVNTIVVVPALNTNYYQNMSEELFIERNINWLRLREVSLSYDLPQNRWARTSSLFVTATDLFMWTNYTGLDPMANGTDAASGGSGGVGIDYANFPIPRAINLGLRVGF